jgi:hypothetical protein
MGSKVRLNSDVDLTQVDGVRVEARTPAKFKAGGIAAKDGRTEFEADGIDEIMLADGRVLYQCVTRPNGCGRTFPNAVAVRSHLKVHSGKAMLARTLAQATELETQLAEAQREIKSLARMKENRDIKIMALQADLRQLRADYETRIAELEQGTDEQPKQPMTDEEHAKMLSAYGSRAAAFYEELRKLLTDFGGTLASMAPPDPEIIEKAARYDQFKNLLT